MALTLLANGQAVHQVMLVSIGRSWTIISMEQSKGVWQGSHGKVDGYQDFTAARERLCALSQNWAKQPGNTWQFAISKKSARVRV